MPAPDELLTEQLLIEDRIELIERPLGKGTLRLEHALTALGGSRRDPALFIQEGGHTAGIGRRDICVSLAVLRDQVSKPIAPVETLGRCRSDVPCHFFGVAQDRLQMLSLALQLVFVHEALLIGET